MVYRSNTFMDDLKMDSWWMSIVVCVIGNMLIWLVIPEYLDLKKPGGITNDTLISGYAAVQAVVAKIFNLVMALIFAWSLHYNFGPNKKREF